MIGLSRKQFGIHVSPSSEHLFGQSPVGGTGLLFLVCGVTRDGRGGMAKIIGQAARTRVIEHQPTNLTIST